jgi:arylamine N-acetyltransferase
MWLRFVSRGAGSKSRVAGSRFQVSGFRFQVGRALEPETWNLQPDAIMPSMNILKAFISHFHIQTDRSPRQLLDEVVTAFSSLPYENITKIIKRAEYGSAEKARRYSEEVIGDHIAWGSGGTCFSLTFSLLQLVRSLGFNAECILADRRYGQDTHCALLVWIDEVPHLLDPGFLIVNPIPISHAAEREIETGFNRLVLAPEGREDRYSLSTVRQGSKTYRLSYKTSPVDHGEFLSAWDASFDWDMMHYPLLTRNATSGQIYLRGSRIQISSRDSVERREIAGGDLAAQISTEFHIDRSVVAHALSILKNGRHSGGKTSIR